MLTRNIAKALKVRITGQNWLRAGIEALVVGGIVAAAAYVVGMALREVA